MSRNLLAIVWCLAALGQGFGAVASTATFGKAVSIGGHASDIALDESRGVLYIANFSAGRIEMLTLADNSIRSSMNLSSQRHPSALAISPDSRYLVVTHSDQQVDVSASSGTAGITVIDLTDGTQSDTVTDKPLGLAFTSEGCPTNCKVLVVTGNGFELLDPATMMLEFITSFANLSVSLPVPFSTFPAEIVETQLTASQDGAQVYGLATAATGGQILYRYETARKQVVMAQVMTAVPALLPRVSVADDGLSCIAGYARFDQLGHVLAQFPDVIATKNVGGHALDSRSNTLYAHVPDTASRGASVTPAPFGSAGPLATAGLPVLTVMDADNMTVQERLYLTENITGRALLNGPRDVMYAVSDSGVLVLPVGSRNRYPRLKAAQEDIVVRSTFCEPRVVTVNVNIWDPSGSKGTDFTISSNTQGVTIEPRMGTTPAVVQVRVDPNAFANTNGVVSVPLQIASATAVNIPSPIRLLINSREPDQRGTPVNVPGTLSDLLPDPGRDRFYVVRQDRNQVLVFDGTSYEPITALRTATTPTWLTITRDARYLLAGHDNAQIVSVFDLEQLDQAPIPILFPFGHYPRMLAASNKKMLAVARLTPSLSLTGGTSAAIGPPAAGAAPPGPAPSGSTATSSTGTSSAAAPASVPAVIENVDFLARRAAALPSLGIYMNGVSASTVLGSSPNGRQILGANPDGSLFLYDASLDTFTAARRDLPSLSGPFAASSYEWFAVGNTLFNSSLVPMMTLESSTGTPSGLAFVDQTGFRTTSPAATSPGIIERIDASNLNTSNLDSFKKAVSKGTRMAESPLTGVVAWPFTRTLAPLTSRAAIVNLTTSGFTVLPWNYDAAVAPPRISSVVNSADQTQPVAPGGLITIYGDRMSAVNMVSREKPLPTALGESCLMVNGIAAPMIMVSGTQLNAQLPFSVDGSSILALHTPGGVSDNFYLNVLPAAPRIFRTGSAGADSGIPTIIRAANKEFVTLSNPIHPKDTITIYATGLGRTSPAVDSGLPAPSDPLPATIIPAAVTIGGAALAIDYAGLVPGEVGVYQINATVPAMVPLGMDVPLTVTQGGSSTSLSVRVVK